MISFRKVSKSDFRTLYKWRNEAHVVEFWDNKGCLTYDDTVLKYTEKLKKGQQDLFIILFNNQDIGFIQTYFLDDFSPYMIKDTSKGVDLFIGEQNFLHKGYGKDILRSFIKNYIFIDERVQYVVIDPELNNKIAIKAYHKAGFEHINTAIDKLNKKMTYYMVLSREKFFCNL